MVGVDGTFQHYYGVFVREEEGASTQGGQQGITVASTHGARQGARQAGRPHKVPPYTMHKDVV